MIPCPPSVVEALSQAAGFPVSRETVQALEEYFLYLESESAKYNLIGPQEIPRFWERHVLDSAQLCPFVYSSRSFVDIGSGAGLPGVVLSILGCTGGVLVESSEKKCGFLVGVSRETGASFEVLNLRAESVRGRRFERVVSRAAAPLDRLLLWSRPLLSPAGKCVFLKGERYEEEVSRARALFHFDLALFPSVTHQNARILEISHIKPK